MTNENIEDPTWVPLVMVVEDVEQECQQRIAHFKSRNCAAIGVKHLEEAIREIKASPGMDLVFTDIDLVGDGVDKSGVLVAQFMTEAGLSIPVYGYSSQFEDDQMTMTERLAFKGWYPKVARSRGEVIAMYDSLKQMAVTHRRERREKIEELLESLRNKHSSEYENFEVVRNLVLSSQEVNDVEQILNHADFVLKIVRPEHQSAMLEPILVWIRLGDDGIYEAEVYGYPELYSFAATEVDAISELTELAQLFAADVREGFEADYVGPALRLRAFLLHAFGGE